MRALRLAALPLLLAACGGAPTGRVPVALDVAVQALNGSEELQFVFLHATDQTGAEVSCADVTVTCVRDQLNRLRPVSLEVDGKAQSWYRVPLDLAQAEGDGQSIELPGIPPGRDYRLVVELVDTSGAGEQRVGVGCTPIDQVVAGENPALGVPLDVLATTERCNPTF